MPIIKSAKKRVRVTRKATARNIKTKRSLRVAIKAFSSALGGTKASDAHKKAQSAIDKAGKKNVMHKNKVARKQRQLSAKAKAAGVKITSTKKAPAKKPVSKKAAAKKPTKK
ncbi:MAG: 30S ribosomal protein S20 [Candidatus Saccharibacteria bacterium]|jgi:small subunit ribosomal protein S20